jgi:hypothetical protein
MGQDHIVTVIAVGDRVRLYMVMAAPLSLAGMGGASLWNCHGFCLFNR